MNILFIPQWYPKKETPFQGAFNVEIAKAISRISNINILTISIVDNLKFGEISYYVNEKPLYEIHYSIGRSPIPKTTFFFLNYLYKKVLKHYFNSFERPDVIHSQDILAYFILKSIDSLKFNIPVVVSQHWTIFIRRQVDYLTLKRFRYIFTKSKCILPAYKNASDNYKDYGLESKVVWLPNSLNIDIFNNRNNIKRENWITHISGFTDQKRVGDVIQSFKLILEEFPEYKLHLIGTGVNEDYFKDLAIKELPKKSYLFHGFMEKEKMAKHLNKSKCFVFTSSFETFGVVLMEAASCNCPIVTTRVGGIKYVLLENEAEFVDVGDIDGIYKKVKLILLNKSNVDINSVRKSIVNRFSEEKVSKILKDIYKNILKT